MTRGRGGVTIPPKNDDVIYEQPLTYVCITHCVIKTHMSWGDDIDIIHVLLAEFLHTHYLTSRWRPVVLRPLQVLIQFSFMNVQF